MKSLIEETVTRTLRELSEKELEHVSGGALQHNNPGDQPHGASQITTTSGNGNAPPGQNKDLPPGLQT
jgi:bacteriocin-like protein